MFLNEICQKEYRIMVIKECPNCNGKNITKVHISSAHLPWWWFIMCNSCKWCGKNKLFLFRAIKAWNKER